MTAHLLFHMLGAALLVISAGVIVYTFRSAWRNITAADVVAGIKTRRTRIGLPQTTTKVTLTHISRRGDVPDRAITANTEAVRRIIFNYSHMSGVPVSVTLSVTGGAHAVDAADVLLRCAAEFKPQLTRADMMPSVSVVGTLGNTVNYRVQIYVPETARGRYGDIESRLRLSAMQALSEREIYLGC